MHFFSVLLLPILSINPLPLPTQQFLHYETHTPHTLSLFVILMHLRVVWVLCGTISFSSKKAAIKMTVYFKIHGVLEFREYSTHLFMSILTVYIHI